VIGCLLRSLVGLFLLAALVWAGWRWSAGDGAELQRWVRGQLGAVEERVLGGPLPPPPDPALAERAFERIELFVAETSIDSILLSADEVASLLYHLAPTALPAGVHHPTVRMEAGSLYIGARVEVARIPAAGEWSTALGVLPDTLPVELRGIIVPFEQGLPGAALRLEGVEVAGVPLPRRLYAPLLDAAGRVPREGLPSDALELPLPPGVGRAYIPDTLLVLLRGG